MLNAARNQTQNCQDAKIVVAQIWTTPDIIRPIYLVE